MKTEKTKNLRESRATRFSIIRKMLGLTQEELADKLKVKRPFISMVESASRWVDQRTLFRIKEITGVSPAWLESGGLVPMFVDIEKGVRTLRKKGYIENKHEAYFIFSIVQQLYALVDMVSKREFLYSLLDCLLRMDITPGRFKTICTCWPASVVGENIEETVEKIKDLFVDKESVPSKTMEYTLCAYCRLYQTLKEEEDFKKEFYDKVNKLLTPWVFYVALVYVALQRGLQPLSSVYIFDEVFIRIIPPMEKIKSFHGIKFNFANTMIYEYQGGFVVKTPYFYFIFSPAELFAFCVAMLNISSIEEQSLKVLDFDIYYKFFDATITKSAVTVFLKQELFDNISYVCSRIKQNKKLWNFLLYSFIEKYGFV